MPLTFPDRSRRFDGDRNAIRFSGQDSFLEASFVVTLPMLMRQSPLAVVSEDSLLALFDRKRLCFQALAAMTYRRGRAGPYILAEPS